MGKKIFVSYKYSDSQVYPLPGVLGATTARDYVDKIDGILEKEDHIFKGEDDGEDMGTLEDATIGSKLGDKIFDSSVTVVFISKGMKEIYTSEKEQWIPWEISYSLKEQSRDGGQSKTNAMLAIVLPDNFNSYDFFITDNSCPNCHCRTLHTDFLFQILRENMFNKKKPEFSQCENHVGNRPQSGYSSYIYSVKWSDFCNSPGKYIDIAVKIRENINDYELVKGIKIMARYAFFSFCYEDVKNFKVNVVRNSWLLNNSKETFIDGSIWEKEKSKGVGVIKTLIEDGLNKTSVTAILIGDETAERRWVKYEIVKSFERGNGILGIHINRIRGRNQYISARGLSPLERLGFRISDDGKKINFYELINRKWIPFSDLTEINNKKSNTLYFEDGWFSNDFGKFFKFSDLFKTYCWTSDEGHKGFSKWVDGAASEAGR